MGEDLNFSDPELDLDHVCLAVRQISAARDMLQRLLGYSPRTNPVLNESQEVVVQFMSKPGSIDIKLIEPSSPRAPLVDFLKRTGGGLHHLAFKTGSVPRATEVLREKGARITAQPEPRAAFNNAPIAFLYAGAGLGIELIDTDERADRL